MNIQTEVFENNLLQYIEIHTSLMRQFQAQLNIICKPLKKYYLQAILF